MGNGVYLSRSQSSNEDSTARKKFTISGWYKLGNNGDGGGWKGFWSAAVDSNNYSSLKQNSDGQIVFEQKSSGTGVSWTSTGKYRDFASWYHIVVAYDSTQASNTDRVKVYINGTQPAGTYGSFTQDQEGFWGNSSATAGIGRYNNNTGSSYMYTGYMTHVACTVGYALAPTVFGETDSTTGEWKIRGAPTGISYSANGFLLKFENSGAMGTDSSGNNNTFTVNGVGGSDGTLVQVTDVPDNQFITMNELTRSSYVDLREGGLNCKGNSSSNNGNVDSNQAFYAGKWYVEMKFVTAASSSATNYPAMGVYPVFVSRQPKDGGSVAQAGYFSDGVQFEPDGQKYRNNARSSYGNSWSTGDIIQIALDMDNYCVYFGINNTWQNSGVPTSGASKTNNAQAWTADEGPYIFHDSPFNGSVTSWNFGNPQHAITSNSGNGYADANGHGKFQYAPPTGYYACCTKNINQYGG